jgi:hypothetical protein
MPHRVYAVDEKLDSDQEKTAADSPERTETRGPALPEGAIPGQPASRFILIRKDLLAGFVLLVLLLALAILDPLLIILGSGFLAATALYLSQRLSPLLGGMVLMLATLAGFVEGGWLTGIVIGSALALAAGYPLFEKRIRREDSHLFLPPLAYWVFLLAGFAAGLMFDGTAVRATLQALRSAYGDEMRQVGPAVRQMLGAEAGASLFAHYITDHVVGWLIGSILMAQTLLSYMALKWVRDRLGWPDPIWGRFILFRLHVAYAIVPVLGLGFLVAGCYVPGGRFEMMGLPLLLWFATGSLLAGLACCGFVVTSLRLSGRPQAAFLCQIGAILLIVLAPQGLLGIGLADLWFDMRKLVLTNRLFFGKGESQK